MHPAIRQYLTRQYGRIPHSRIQVLSPLSVVVWNGEYRLPVKPRKNKKLKREFSGRNIPTNRIPSPERIGQTMPWPMTDTKLFGKKGM